MKRTLLIVSFFCALAIGACAWIGYGNPFREIPESGLANDSGIGQAFFISHCDAKGGCQLNPKYKRVMHFSYGDGIMAPSGNIDGHGWNPVAIARKFGLTFLPEPRYMKAAVKWCTNGEIFSSVGYHGASLTVPIPSDPVKTAKCVQSQSPRNFFVFIGDPQGSKAEHKIFAPLYPSWKRPSLVDD